MASNPEPSMPENLSQNGSITEPALSADERALLDSQVLAGETIPPASLLAVLKSPNPPQEALLQRYAELLLRHALETRDAEASILITRLMDSHPDLDAALQAVWNERLHTEPDAVYAIVRARMNESPTPHWLERLKTAAMCALHVAITDSDSETAVNWLRLVSREPAGFELNTLLHHGLVAAGERARRDAAVGRILIPLTLRRDPAALDMLLADQALLDKLAEETNLGQILRDYEGDALQTLQNHGYDLFVMALARAAQAKKGALFTPAVIEQLWLVITGTQVVSVPAQYQPERILQAWQTDGVEWLDENALQTILVLALRDHRDELFLALVRQLTDRDTYLRLLAQAFQRSGRPEVDIMMLITQLQNSADLTPQGVLDLQVRLLNTWEWRKSAMPVIIQLSRVLNQNPTLPVNIDILWHLLAIAGETKDESLVRIATRRITADLEATEDETMLTDKLLRLASETSWHAPTRLNLIVWWRSFVRSSTLARLQRIDKTLDGKKLLEELRSIIQTIIAFRKMLGKRTLQQFAVDVGTAYNILQALNESFEPSVKRPFTFDQATMRAELDSRSEELTPHEQKIMANNLKELAQLIGGLGDNRSKATLMRRSDDIDRLLMTGDQTPHSAVDALKWLSGYLSGTQDKDEADEE